METVESSSIQALKNEPYQEFFANADPNICSWNHKRYPELKPITSSSKSSSMHQRFSPRSCPKGSKISTSEKEPYNISICTPVCNTPKLYSFTKVKPYYYKKLVNKGFSTSTASPDPFFKRDFQESPKLVNYMNYLNNFTMRKLKSKRIKKEKNNSADVVFGLKNKIFEVLNKVKPPSLDSKKTQILRNKLPLSTAQTLEELLSSTKIKKINKKYLKYKF